MEIEHKEIIRAKVHLQKENPFFAYLVMNLRPMREDEIGSIGVDTDGNLGYNKEWVDKLSEDELKGVLTHEVFHLLLEHFERVGDKDKEIYNISTDLVINNILVNNDFSLPEGLVPYNNRFKFNDNILIENLDKKTADEVYNELMKYSKKKQKDMEGDGFDNHDKLIKSKKGKKGSDNRKEKAENKKKWNSVLSEATAYAKQRGKLPSGMELFVDKLLNEKLNWKSILYKYITRELPFDYSYNRPSKRSRAIGVYMPSVKRESIDIVVAIDTSGSIQQSELSEFLSEIVGISKSFNNINMKLIVCDSEIKDVYDIQNGNIETILGLKIRGGGGTSHIPVYDYIKENLPNTKFVINFTDGYTEFPKDEEIRTIWVLTKGSVSEEGIPFGEVIKLED